MAASLLQIRKTLYDNRLTLDQYGIPGGTVIDTISAARGVLSAAADSAMNSADEGITTEEVRFHLLSARTYSALQCNTWMPHADKEWHHTCLVCAHARHVLHKNIACCMCMRIFGTDAKNMGSDLLGYIIDISPTKVFLQDWHPHRLSCCRMAWRLRPWCHQVHTTLHLLAPQQRFWPLYTWAARPLLEASSPMESTATSRAKRSMTSANLHGFHAISYSLTRFCQQ